MSCPTCGYKPDGSKDWNCQACGSEFDMFAAGGACTTCNYVHELTPCIPWRGGCDAINAHLDWYEGIDEQLRDLGIVRNQDK